jgi:hypothetical protein
VHKVIIDPWKRWQWDAERRAYVEVEEGEKPWFAEAAEVIVGSRRTVEFPPRCPHCGGTPTTTRTLSATRRRSGFLRGVRLSGLVISNLPSCPRVPRPLPAYFLQLFLAFVTVAAGLAILATPYAALVALVGLAASLALWRARTWIHLPEVVDEVLVFEVRDALYAHSLARLNHGRVDERRAPLPTAIVKN